MSPSTWSGRVRGRPRPGRGTRMPSNTGTNRGESPRWPAMITIDSGFWPCSQPSAAWCSSLPGSARGRDRPALCRPRPGVRLARPLFPGTSRMLMRPGHGGVDTDILRDQLVGVGIGLQVGQDPLPRSVALPPAEQPVERLPRAVSCRKVPPVRTRYRIPLISVRLECFGGRPGFVPSGSNGSSFAHCSLVRSPRPTPRSPQT